MAPSCCLFYMATQILIFLKYKCIPSVETQKYGYWPSIEKQLMWQFLARFGLKMNYARIKNTYFSKGRISKSLLKISYALEPNISQKELGNNTVAFFLGLLSNRGF